MTLTALVHLFSPQGVTDDDAKWEDAADAVVAAVVSCLRTLVGVFILYI